MSKRYGRNQRRRARERIAALEEALLKEKEMLKWTARQWNDARDEIRSAKSIASEHCAAFNPRTMQMNVTESDYVMLTEMERFDLRYMPDWTRPLHIEQVPLPVMIALADPEWRRLSRHVLVQYQGKRYGYGVNMIEFMSARDPIRYLRVVGEILAQMIHAELTRPQAPRRPLRASDVVQLNTRL